MPREEQIRVLLIEDNNVSARAQEAMLVHNGNFKVQRTGTLLTTLDLLTKSEFDIALLDQIVHRQAIAAVAARNVNHETQVREHELAGRGQIVMLPEALSELLLALAREHRNAAHALQIGVEAADRPGQAETGCRGNCSLGTHR